jgi:hypothetical protein
MNDILSSLSPEEIHQLMGLSTADEQEAQLQAQLQQAEELRRAKSGAHTTGLGAALGGLGDVVNSGIGAYQQHKLHGQEQDLLGQKRAGREKYLEILRRAQLGDQLRGTGGMGDMGALSPFAFG